MRRRVRIYEISRSEIEALIAKVKSGEPLTPREAERFERIARAYVTVSDALQEKNANVRRLLRTVFGAKTEKTRSLLGEKEDSSRRFGVRAPKPRKRPPGHGRNGAARYPGARKVCVPHETLQPGDRCPGCGKGKVYEQARPGVLVRVTGQAPLEATVYHLQKLRCNLCGEIFTARPPDGDGQAEKYDASCAAMIALLKYGSGIPFHRLGRLQGHLGVPLPPATQWKIVSGAAGSIGPVFEELILQAAQSKVVHNDDTAMRILTWMGKRRKKSLAEEPKGHDPKRTGIFTSGILSVIGRGRRQRRIALFFTGRKHAGENLADVLARRRSGLSPPIQMADALSRNVPSEELQTILANCLAHGRRQFVDVAEAFPGECEHILKVLQRVYRYDAVAKKRGMTGTQRLKFHREKSGPLMEKLHAWMSGLLERKKVEPNSGLGEAIRYMLKHWKKLTLFLGRPNAPLDNNVVERALKKAILHRKNALFYKTDNGAKVGDLFMSLIHTCELNGADPFDYLTQLMRHPAHAKAHPADWMPWNYQDAVRRCRAA